MKTSGSGIFFDGVTSTRHDAKIELAPAALEIRSGSGELTAEWPYPEIQSLSAPDGLLRIGRVGSMTLARLEIRDPELAAAIEQRSGAIDRSSTADRRGRVRVVAWSLAAVVSLVLAAVFGVPAIASRLAPLIPVAAEHRFGATVDKQIRSLLDTGPRGRPFECGTAQGAQAGQAAFDKLVRKLEAAAALHVPLRAVVVRRPEANAMAIPGGYVYVFHGLINKANTPDEFAGVLAHEIGHVAHRDGTRAAIQAAGLSFLFGMLLGDFGGGGAVVIAARTVLRSSYSRETEAAADAYGARLIAKLGGDPRALGAILLRIAGTTGPSAKILLDHPEAKDRAAAIDAVARPAARTALLEPREWSALKQICAER